MFDVEDALEADTDERGKIEDACHLAAKAIINEPCGGYDRNPMLVAITNRFVFFNIYYYRGSPDSTVSLSTVPGLVRFSNSTK